jgi:phospholipid/cholesterol/gamma-HCH transport system permease protein
MTRLKANAPSALPFQLEPDTKGGYILFLKDRIDAYQAGPLITDLRNLLKDQALPNLIVDLSALEFMDDYGVLVLSELKEMVSRKGGKFLIRKADKQTQNVLSVYDLESIGKIDLRPQQTPSNPFIFLGEQTINKSVDFNYMISFVGSVFLAGLHILRHPSSLRRDDTLVCMQQTGVNALPIVGLISFLLGLIMAFMSSFQLRQFGANIYVADLVGLAMTRELGPIITAIIVAGRSGSSFAAEIGTMKISEEVDALFTMGFDPTRFLVLPKIIAAVIVVPFLTLFSDLFAILGGLIVGVLVLDLTPSAYITQTINSLGLFDVFLGFTKGGVFALLIAWIGCFRGFRVSGGAAAVGRATTSAVVSSILLIIVTDSVFAIIVQYWS